METICACGHYASDHDGFGCTRIGCKCVKVYYMSR
jgi:hypothetical protein